MAKDIRIDASKPIPTLSEVAEQLANPIRAGFILRPGRTLPVGHVWSGHDIPGRGNAAARRLRQQQRLAEKRRNEQPVEPSGALINSPTTDGGQST